MSLWDKVAGRKEWTCFLVVGCSTFPGPGGFVSEGKVENQHSPERGPLGLQGVDTRDKLPPERRRLQAFWGNGAKPCNGRSKKPVAETCLPVRGARPAGAKVTVS